MPSQQLAVVIDHLRDIARRSLETPGDVEEKRKLVDEYFDVDESVMACDVEPVPVTIDYINGEWILVDNSDPDRRLLYLHGGSWMAGRVARYRPHIARIAAATGCAVLAIDYRLTPECPFPAGLEDCVTAYEWMLAHGPDGDRTAQFCFIAGDSAGGNLTLASMLVIKDGGIRLPDAAITLSAATDFTWTGESFRTRAAVEPALNAEFMPLITRFYLQHDERPDIPYASPLFGNLAGLPPVLLQVGDAEILLDDSTRFAKRASEAGVDAELQVFPYMPHVFQGFAPYLPEAVEALEKITKFVKKYQ